VEEGHAAMTAQIIFFTAVALFLVILLRRAVWLETIWRYLVVVARAVSRFSLQLLSVLRARIQARGMASRVSRLDRSRRAQSDGQTNSASFWREELIEEKPEIMTHYDEGETLFKAGKLDEAERFFLTAATRNPKDSKVYARLGLIYLQKKNYTDAVEALKVAVKLDKFNPSRHYNLALAYEGKRDNQRAIATIREAISLDPVSAKYRTLLEQLLNKK
jgi:tetratricopeptide (TPR) repeat protein